MGIANLPVAVPDGVLSGRMTYATVTVQIEVCGGEPADDE
jgi:hypothetical protein